jgi:hypothetical protein
MAQRDVCRANLAADLIIDQLPPGAKKAAQQICSKGITKIFDLAKIIPVQDFNILQSTLKTINPFQLIVKGNHYRFFHGCDQADQREIIRLRINEILNKGDALINAPRTACNLIKKLRQSRLTDEEASLLEERYPSYRNLPSNLDLTSARTSFSYTARDIADDHQADYTSLMDKFA